MSSKRSTWPYAPRQSLWSWLFRRDDNLIELGSPPKALEHKSAPKPESGGASLRTNGDNAHARPMEPSTRSGKPFFLLVLQAIVSTFNWNGRASRREFGAYVVFYVGVLLFGGFLPRLAEDYLPAFAGISLPTFIWFILFLTLASVSLRRMHDTGRRGWWVLLSVTNPITALLSIYRLLQPGDPGTNEFGPPPED
ncbi:MAG: DUF805 domain-containing protein [Henriciella sp.]|nr:DUF805 domain-containing protein [Henriciella sp.]